MSVEEGESCLEYKNSSRVYRNNSTYWDNFFGVIETLVGCVFGLSLICLSHMLMNLFVSLLGNCVTNVF